jgi:hypothetical protein
MLVPPESAPYQQAFLGIGGMIVLDFGKVKPFSP